MKENRQNQKSNKKKRSMTARIILAVLIIIILLLVHRCSQLKDGEGGGKETNVATLEYEEDVDAITEIDTSKRQEAVNAKVEEGMMNVNYSPNAVFVGKVSESFNVKNIKNNHGPIVFELFDEDENSIYQSKMIAPGYEIKCIELNTELEKGTHDCTIKVRYAEGGNVVAAFPITIEVR